MGLLIGFELSWPRPLPMKGTHAAKTSLSQQKPCLQQQQAALKQVTWTGFLWFFGI
jgi:hypothetical protein